MNILFFIFLSVHRCLFRLAVLPATLPDIAAIRHARGWEGLGYNELDKWWHDNEADLRRRAAQLPR